jgi:hypothetical protein
VRDDQPRHQRGQPEQHDHGEAESAERIAHLPDGVRGERERGRAERADQQFGQAQQSPPRAIGPHHSGQQPQSADQPRGDVTHFTGVGLADHPADSRNPACQLGRCPVGRRQPRVGSIREQAAHEIRNYRADRSQLPQPQRG